MTTSKQETWWVLRAQCNDREALECLLAGVQPYLHRYIRGLVGSFHADDVLQEVLILVCRNLNGLRTAELFRPWVYRIASRAAFRYLKKENRAPEQSYAESVPPEQVAAPPTRPPDEIIQSLLEVDGIPATSRAVLALHFQQELPLAEVAAILDIPLGTAKSRLAAGLAALRNQFREKGVCDVSGSRKHVTQGAG